MGVLNAIQRSRAALAPVLVAVLVASCSVEAPSDVEYGAQDLGSDAVGEAGSDLGGGDAAVLNTFDGTWLMWSELSTCVALGTIGEESINRTLFLIEADYDEDTRFVDETWQACTMELPAVFGAQTFATQALYDTSYPVHSTGGYVTGTHVGAGYTSGQVPELWGWSTEDPFTDPMPTTNDDPRIADTDGDGNPGVTVLVRGGGDCETYLIQRALTTFDGVFVAPDRIEGRGLSYTKQFTVGSSTAFCGSLYSSRSNDARNRFTRIRVDGRGNSRNLDANSDGRVTCDEVTPLVDTLFDRTVPNDDLCQ